MKEDVIQHSGKPTPAHCSVASAPAGVVLVGRAHITTSDQVHNLIVAVDIPSTEKPHQELKQIVIDVLTTLVLPPVTADIIICSHSDDNTNPDMTCDYSLYKEICPQTRTFHIPEVIEPDIITDNYYASKYYPSKKNQIRGLNKHYERLLEQQFLHHKTAHRQLCVSRYNIIHK
jgi:hypothetical protein